MDQNGVHQDGEALLAEMEKTIPHKVAACAAHMLLEPGNTVLDAGCADGQVTAYFALKYPEVHVIGVDYDPIYIQKARDKFGHIPNLEFIQADLRALDLGERKLDAIMNLSILHEPYSYTGYRTQSVEDIITAELKNLKPGGVIINRDFVLPDKPDDMVYLALKDDGSTGDSPENLSLPDLLELYSREAMRFDNGDPQGHIKGFFLEDHTARFKNADHGIPEGWRVFYLPHQWAWEFGWRAQYKLRFYNEAEEKYAYWTAHEQRQVPEKLGARVLYAAPVENPWIMQNWYQPNMMLFDAGMKRLPLQPSNFISVLEKIQPGASITLREHQQADAAPTYLQTSSFVNPHNNWQYDMVKRPGGDVVDIIPYYFEGDDLMILAKSGYPRPLINTRPRMMSQNLDGKTWSGHIIEPLAKAQPDQGCEDAIRSVLCERAGINPAAIRLDSPARPALVYYTAPSELNERASALHVEITQPPASDITLQGGFSGFSQDGLMRTFNAHSLLAAAQAGMMAEARLEANIYALMHNKGVPPGPWIGRVLALSEVDGLNTTSLDEMLKATRAFKVFKPSDKPVRWLDVVRSQFHEVSLQDSRHRLKAKHELEFAVPSLSLTKDVSTNSVMLVCLVKDKTSGEVLIGLQKITPVQSQFPAVQQREDYSGHITIPGLRLPSHVKHAQFVPEWIAQKTGVPEHAIRNLGEGYFPTLGIMPNRVFPFCVTEPSDYIKNTCDFLPLREVFQRLDELQDLHTMIAVQRAVHALDLWENYTQPAPETAPAAGF